MSENGIPVANQMTSEEGRHMPVPWDEADNLRRELAKRGYSSTLYLDSRAHSARLEFWPGAELHAVLAALNELLPPAQREPSSSG